MELILWRHAEAEDEAEQGPSSEWEPGTGAADMNRCLTARGHKQAVRMANWLDTKLIDTTRVLVSPAMRCEQTVIPLGRKYKICPELAPGANVDDLLRLIQWPGNKLPVLVVGHQPVLAQVVTCLLGFDSQDMVFRKGSVWWLRSRERNGQAQTVVVTVQSTEFL